MGKSVTTSKAGRRKRPATKTEETAKSCRKCNRWKEVKQRMRVAEFIEKTVGKVEAKLAKDEISPTMAEYLKLLQMEQDWEQQDTMAEGPKEIKVTWVGPTVEPNSEK